MISTIKQAEHILQQNVIRTTINNISYRYLIPSKDFYVHQWNWDSATHAMALIYIDESLAFDEMRSLLSGQWENGLIPHIRFNPQEKKYFPGPEFWGTEAFTNGEILTSGITQPPLIGVSLHYIWKYVKESKEKEKFIDEALPKVIHYLRYLKKYRDNEDSGLVTIVHPWESGTDNSPRWDAAMDSIEIGDLGAHIKELVSRYRTDNKLGEVKDRPRYEDYYRYIYLMLLYKSLHWDYERIIKETPFAMKDILFTSIWLKAVEGIAEILASKGDVEGENEFMQYARHSRKALESTWDAKMNLYIDRNVSQGKDISVLTDTIAGFSPIIAGIPNADQINKIVQKLSDKDAYNSYYPVPSTALDSPAFDQYRYWRGPSWPITNMFLIDGLSYYPDNEKCMLLQKKLIRKTKGMIRDYGFFEYFDSLRPKSNIANVGHGFSSFSWTAAIYIYLSHMYKDNK